MGAVERALAVGEPRAVQRLHLRAREAGPRVAETVDVCDGQTPKIAALDELPRSEEPPHVSHTRWRRRLPGR